MSNSIQMNEVLSKLPKHLLDLVIDQPYNEYTAVDHAVWRYVMRQNVDFLSGVAHESYIEGLRKTGIGVEEIPHMYGMNRILKEIGWAAVAVDGFIPPQAFMEFQAYNVLVIAADIRNIEHIPYTPAPDIIHEAAGHAPIIADKDYSHYLKLFGQIGAKAFSSKKDYELYEAIRHLSIIKENPHTKVDVVKAEEHIEYLQNNMGEPSEMSKIRNLHWWTVEYGLIGDINDYKIYGAGLLSSIGESANCMDDERVKKLPYTLDAVNYNFDITTEQPQLFVTPSFDHLNKVLLAFSENMAYKKGGIYAVETAISSNNLATIRLNTGLQIGGVCSEFKKDKEEIIYLKCEGPTQLAFDDKQLDGHGKNYHQHGYSTILGYWEGVDIAPSCLVKDQLQELGIVEGEKVALQYKNGISLKGKLKSILYKDGQLLLLAFEECTVKLGDEYLFKPEWGVFDLAIGESVQSTSSGVPDALAYGVSFEPPKEKTLKINYTAKERKLHQYYQQVRDMRAATLFDEVQLKAIFEILAAEFPKDWLLSLEILEMVAANRGSKSFETTLRDYLNRQQNLSETYPKLIQDGIRLIESNTNLIYSE